MPDHTLAVVADEPLLTLRFPFDVYQLRAGQRRRLEDFVRETWPRLPRKPLLVVGYTDDIGPQEYNDRLARRRAESVARALRDLGISSVRIEARAKCCYVGDNETREGRARNRRAEIHLYQPDGKE